ncbi:MAG: hypothetical protein IJB52_11200 [Clostridia bacterium]|nr:hypothetical protein [Clostridia bacterium]
MCPEEKRENTAEEVGQSNAAKRLQALGKMDESDDTSDVQPEKGSRLSNFWYHHKWKVIIITAFAFIFVSLGTQFVGKSNPDIKILYAGPLYFTPNQSSAVSACMYDLMEDSNGDGEKKIAVNDLVYMTAQQMLDAEEAALAREEEFAVNRQSNAQTAEQFTYEIMAGDSLICFLAPDQYESVAAVEAFVPLEEIFGYIPEGAVDGCGLRLCETKFYKYYTAVQIFGEDTVIALKKLTTINKMKGEEMELYHARHMDLFRKIGAFAYPEGYVPPEETASPAE